MVKKYKKLKLIINIINKKKNTNKHIGINLASTKFT